MEISPAEKNIVKQMTDKQLLRCLNSLTIERSRLDLTNREKAYGKAYENEILYRMYGTEAKKKKKFKIF